MQSFDDDVLGRVVWSLPDQCWTFYVVIGRRHRVPATYIPDKESDQRWDRIRRTVQWVRKNERLVQNYVRGKANNAPSSFTGGRLSGITFHKGEDARLIYEEFHDAVCVQIDPEGRIVADPFWIVSG